MIAAAEQKHTDLCRVLFTGIGGRPVQRGGDLVDCKEKKREERRLPEFYEKVYIRLSKNVQGGNT